MGAVWNPAFTNSSGTSPSYLPRPILQLGPTYEWKMEQFDVPMRDGTDIHGCTLKGPRFQISGQATRDSSGPILNSSQEFVNVSQIRALETLRAFLYSNQTNGVWLVTHYISTNPVVGWKNLFPVSFNFDAGDGSRVVVPYSIILQAKNPRCYFNVNTSDAYAAGNATFGPEYTG